MVKRKHVIEYYLDHVGRRRKLSHGAMLSIQRAYSEGESTADLAESYGVSTSLIRVITYNTARKTDPIIEGVVHKEKIVDVPSIKDGK